MLDGMEYLTPDVPCFRTTHGYNAEPEPLPRFGEQEWEDPERYAEGNGSKACRLGIKVDRRARSLTVGRDETWTERSAGSD